MARVLSRRGSVVALLAALHAATVQAWQHAQLPVRAVAIGRRRAVLRSTASSDLIETDGLRVRRLFWDQANDCWTKVIETGAGPAQPIVGDFSGTRSPRGSFATRVLREVFVPDGVTPDYFAYTRWRCFQRFISATVNVFGTQAMLLALGIKTQGALGTAAAVSWVLKDALGKIGRIAWAGRMGRKFDADAKRWRFRASLLFATGNGLEIVTYVFPASFLLLATGANCLKQISMLTSSATRNAIYRSFAAEKNNIGEISAKGEAQIAVVDLLGMLCGILLVKATGTSRLHIGVFYLVLSAIDLLAIYQEIRSVVFKGLNFERASLVLRRFIVSGEVSTPAELAKQERIFRQSRLRHGTVFRGAEALLGRKHGHVRTPQQVQEALQVFKGEKFAVVFEGALPVIVVHTEVSQRIFDLRSSHSCVLRRLCDRQARSPDIFKALLVWTCVMHRLSAAGRLPPVVEYAPAAALSSPRPDDDTELVAAALDDANSKLSGLVAKLEAHGWETERFMFSVPNRIHWAL